MKSLKPLLLVVVLMLSALLVACSPASAAEGDVVTLIIGPEKVECVGLINPAECFQVKYSTDEEEWGWFHTEIEGFTYEPGFVYELRVRTEKIENPPTDSSNIRWILVEEVSKTPSTEPLRPDNADLINIPWVLTAFGDGTELVAGTDVTLTLTADGVATGNASINNYNGSYTIDGETITFSPFASTKMGGDPALMSQESAFLELMARAVTFKKVGPSTVFGSTLTLFDSDGTVLLVFEGPRG